MASLNIAGYIQGAIYPNSNNTQPVSQTISDLQSSGLETVILGLAHIGRDYAINPIQITGDLYFNGTLIFSQGSYVGDASWPAEIDSLIGGSIKRVCLSIGGAGNVIYDFQTIMKIYQGNNNSFSGTNLEANFRKLKTTLPKISVIDMDCEETYDQASFVAFCQMLIGIGFEITFCPYRAQSFWTGSLAALETSNPGAVKWINLQCYDGGGSNDPANWAQQIKTALTTFDTDGFILAGDWSRFIYYSNGQPVYWMGRSTADVQSHLHGFSSETCVGGGFIWTLDQIIDYQHNQSILPDPSYAASNGSISDYVKAILKAL